jgi:methionyl-tRNA synthetase
MTLNSKWYVTTPIYYVTAQPHLGSLYSTLLADVSARWHRLRGNKVFFLTGTDEHGQKIALAASKAGKQPKEFVDSFIEAYQNAWKKYDISYDYFIRTTDDYHVRAVQEWIKNLLKKGDIYKGHYTGWYCTPCETFVAENEEATAPACPSCGRPTISISEESYFFRLSAYQDKLLKLYEDNPDFINPRERMQEVVQFVKRGLKDLSISRTTVQWGIPFPDDEHHITYVWADALNNYITAVGYGRDADALKYWWPANLQVMGKDIVRFHAIYWPAFLMASDLAVPRQLLVHGWIKMNQQKMSKSFGNVVDPLELRERYGSDEVRYYLMRYMAITHDGEFSIESLEHSISSDLANDLGNLFNRVVSLAHQHEYMQVVGPSLWNGRSLALRDECLSMIEDVNRWYDETHLHMALARIWRFINTVNAYFHECQPWKLAKSDPETFKEVIAAACHALQAIALMTLPVMPQKMNVLLHALGIASDLHAGAHLEKLSCGTWNDTFLLTLIPPLFTRIEPMKTTSAVEKTASDIESITIQDFSKMHLVVGTIIECKEIEGSDKLLELTVSCGAYGTRTILSGVKKDFSPDDLKGTQGVFVLNLPPRPMMGRESQGMMLFAKDTDGKLVRSTVTHTVPDGTRLQ